VIEPVLLVLSSPSGGGKTTIARRLLATRSDTGYSVSATTRAPRPGEEDGRDYRFLSSEEFGRREAAGEFVETASYNGQRYGTLRSELDRVLGSGMHLVLDIEIEGARQVRRHFPHSVQVFVLPPSGAVLVERLRARRTEAPEAFRRRLQHALDELGAVAEYDYVVVNDELDRAVAEVNAILEIETRRVGRQRGLERFVSDFRMTIARELEG
jgi:guanylate kinase